MSATELAARADALRALHQPGRPLVLPNAWDAASARAVVQAGFPAVATTSAGVAAALGWPDGEGTPPDEMLAAVARIARAVEVPVTADLEGGYGLAPADLVRGLLDAGAVGCNLEDTAHGAGAPGPLRDADHHAGYLAAVKEAGRQAGVDLVLNARVDVFVRRVGDEGTRTAEACRRAVRYREAGADCVYPITLRDPGAVRELVAAAEVVNVLALPDWLAAPELAALGVARISYGGGLFRLVERSLTALLATVAAEARPAE
jgi:2-methylisocitrate lyase-like PEP mutase family enzyme